MSKNNLFSEEFIKCNEQLTKNDLIKLIDVESSYLEKLNLSIEYIDNLFKSYDLDINNIYIKDTADCTAYYLTDYVCSDFILSKDILENENFGVNRISIRCSEFKKMFDEKKYTLIFHAEFNKMPIYSFLQLYKKIDTNAIYDVFENMKSTLLFGKELINEEVYNYVMKYKTA